MLWLKSFILVVILLKSLSNIGRKQQYQVWLSQIITILIWTPLASWARRSTPEKGLQPTTSEKPTMCSVFLSLLVKRQQIPQPLPPGENVQVSSAYKPQVFFHIPGDDLGARRFPQVLPTWGRTSNPSLSKNPLVSGRPPIQYSPFPAVITTCSSQHPWLIYNTGSWDR